MYFYPFRRSDMGFFQFELFHLKMNNTAFTDISFLIL